jgi:digeranylgeranylglycerophospholipid reductase
LRTHYDAVVIGAGPAGSATARDIAREGFKVLVLEEHAAVGRPTHCSGLVTPRTLEMAGVGPDIVLNRIVGAHIHTPSGKELVIGGDRVHALVVDRARFDNLLCRQAQEGDAVLELETRFSYLEKEGRFLRIHVDRDGRRRSLLTKLLIGADGASSTVAAQTGLHRADGSIRCLTAEVTGRVPSLELVEILLDKNSAPAWFGWALPMGDGRWQVGTGVADGFKPLDSLRLLRQAFPTLLGNMRAVRFKAGLLPLWRPMKPYTSNVLLVGDAARQVKPTSGGGIYSGLMGARLAACVAVEALREENLSGAFLSRYHKMFMDELGDEFKRATDVRRAFLSLNNERLDRLLAMLNDERRQQILREYGDIDFPSRLFYELAKDAPSLLTLLRAPLRYPWTWLPWRYGSGN